MTELGKVDRRCTINSILDLPYPRAHYLPLPTRCSLSLRSSVLELLSSRYQLHSCVQQLRHYSPGLILVAWLVMAQALAVVSGSKISDCISDVKISEVQREVERTASAPILPPQPSGNYEIDESVKACEIRPSSVAWTSLTLVSLSGRWNESRTCAELWYVFMGEDRKSRCRIAVWRREDLFP